MEKIKLNSLGAMLPINICEVKKSELKNYFLNSWSNTELIFSSIIDSSSLYLSPDQRRHPLIFYYGHVAAFYINKLRIAGLYKSDLDFALENLFAVGVDPSTKDDLEKYGWPEYSKVSDFRANVFNIIIELLDNNEIPSKIDWSSPYWVILMGIEHERIHFETTSVLLRQMPTEYLQKPINCNYILDPEFISDNEYLKIPEGKIILGRPTESKMYGWDNEYGVRPENINTFFVSKNMVTNNDYLEFVIDGGYNKRELWSDSGWDWIKQQGIEFPNFWIESENNNFKLRAMFDVIEMPLNWPVEVIAHEAEAFCKWKGNGFRLMNEMEWKRITDIQFESPAHDFDSIKANTNFVAISPSPVGYFGGKAPYDIIGNVWEILADDFNPLPGFKEHPYYKDFSLPFFDSVHGMMAGGSWASTGNSASRYYRLWFRRDFVQHAGFRLVKDI